MLKASNNFIQSLKKQKRENSSLLFLDNIKIIKDAISSGLKPIYILVNEKNISTFDYSYCPILLTEDKVIQQLADTKTPQGVLCVIEYTQHIVEKPTTNFLILDGLQDPGNVGTLIRTAYACGFNYVYLVSSVNPTNPKVIRSSVGSIFHANVYSVQRLDFVEMLKEWKIQLVATDMHGENVFKSQLEGQIGVVIGNEGQGISDEIFEICTKTIRIPMQEGIESLNASISGAIIMYQINKDKL